MRRKKRDVFALFDYLFLPSIVLSSRDQHTFVFSYIIIRSNSSESNRYIRAKEMEISSTIPLKMVFCFSCSVREWIEDMRNSYSISNCFCDE